MPGERRGALPLFLVILAILFFGVGVVIARGGDDGEPRADDTPAPTFTTPETPFPTDTEMPTPNGNGGTIPPDITPTEPNGTETPTTPPATTAPPATTTAPPAVSPTGVLPSPDGLATTGAPVLAWMAGGLALMLLAGAMLRALSRPAAR